MSDKLKLLETYTRTCKLIDERWKALADPETGELDMSYYFSDAPLRDLIKLKNDIVRRLKTEHDFVPERERIVANDRTTEKSPPNRNNRDSTDISRAIEGHNPSGT